MELEEPDDEEWNHNYASKYYLSPESDGNNNSNGKVSWVLKRGVNIGKKILMAGLVASSAPIIVPPLVVASAIGIAVSMPYAFFLASHACTENLMSRLLPRPTITHQDPNNKFILDDYEEEGGFHQDVIEKEEECIECEADGEVGVVGGVEHVNNEKDVTLSSDYGKGVVEEEEEEEGEGNAEPQMHDDVKLTDEIEDEGTMERNVVTQTDDDVKLDEKEDEGIMEGNAELQINEFGDEKDEGIIEGNAEPQMHDDVKVGDEKEDEGIVKENTATPMDDDDVKLGDEIEDDRIMEGDLISGEELVSGGHGVVITIEDLDDENGDNDIIQGEFKAPFEVMTVSVEEFGDVTIEGDIEEEELQRETKGLLEKIRDEGREDSGGEFVDGSTNESDHEIGPVENLEVPHHENQSCITVEGAEGDARGEEERRKYEEMLESSNVENKDTIFAEVESAEPVSGMFEEKDVGELVIKEDYNVPVSEDSSEATGEKIDTDIVVKVEPKPVLDGATVLQEGKLDNISDSVNQESHRHEHYEAMSSSTSTSDADATKIAGGSRFDLSDGKRSDSGADAYTIDLPEESSNVVVDGHTAPTEVPVSASEQDLKPTECSSGKDIMCPSAAEVAFDEDSIWKQIHVIRKIIGYEATAQASCVDELKALYIFTGVEPPNFVNENSCDPAELNEKLHFLMSIVGVK